MRVGHRTCGTWFWGDCGVKIHIMTDMEGCAGVIDAVSYTGRDSRYYELGCELATLEASAAVEGALEAGATEVLVVDGHGPGAMRRHLLHPRAKLLAGKSGPLWAYDGSFAAAMIVGQHAKSNTDGGHLCHTGNFGAEDYVLNDISMGETGELMLLAGYFGVPVVMLGGDQAACDEARALVPNIEVAPVKFGIGKGSATGLSTEENRLFNTAAIHLHPDEARALIRERAYRAVRRIPEFVPLRFDPPYRLTVSHRPEKGRKRGESATLTSKDLLDLLLAGRKRRAAVPARPAKKLKRKGPAKRRTGKTRKRKR